MKIKKIGIIGTGAVGGYFGGKICHYMKSNKAIKVFFIARGDHLKEIQRNGLHLSTQTDGDFVCRSAVATDNINELPELDLAIVCVKSYDLKDIMISVDKKLHSNSIVLPLLNGIDIYERINEILKNRIIIPACVYVGTHIDSPGKIIQKGGACKILFGNHPDNKIISLDNMINLFNQSMIKFENTNNIYNEIWKKYIFIAAFGLVTAAYEKTLGEVLKSNELSSMIHSVMNEIYELSKKKNINLPSDIINFSFNKANDFPFGAKTSFQRDFEIQNKKDERDLFSSSIIKLGKEFNIQTPDTIKLHEIIQRRKPQSNI
ncbi:MAG: ketopantoate reductase family protein [Spirochaetia bacterium]|nr:ketopantoate reductase family protein [Spirochaetia bacterium]